MTDQMSEGIAAQRIEDRPSVTVVDALSREEGVDPLELDTPLYDVVDPEALDALLEESDADDVTVSFTYESYDVTIDGDRLVLSEVPDA